MNIFQSWLKCVVLAACLSCVVSCSAAESAHVAGLDSAQSNGAGAILPTHICGDLFIAETYINGSGPYAMVLDTGASATVISPAVARQTGARKRIKRIEIGGVKVTGRMRCIVRDVDHLSDAIGTHIDGILGHPVFRKALLTYDYPAQEVRVRLGELQDDVPGVAPMSTSRRPFLGAMIGDRKINVLLDTGSSHGLSLKKFSSLPLQEEATPVGTRMRMDGLSIVYAGRLEVDVRFGSLTLATPIVINAAGDSLLGTEILRNYIVTIDQQRGRVQITHPDGSAIDEPVNTPTLYGAGWAIAPQKNRAIVRRVFKGSAAEAAGVQAGDALLAIDGVAYGALGCERHVRDDNSPRDVEILIERDGAEIMISLTTDVLAR